MTGEGDESYPLLIAMVDFVISSHKRLQLPAEGSEKLLFEPKAFVALVDFLRECPRQGSINETAVDSSLYQGEC